jgi:hypothetical protein
VLRRHLLERLPQSPLMRIAQRTARLRLDVWIAAGDVELDRHVVVEARRQPDERS